MSLRLTNSELTTFRRCKRKWWLVHHRGLRRKHEEVAGTPLTLGSAVHETLAAYYASHIDGPIIVPAEHCRQMFEDKIVEFPAAEQELRKEMDLALAMVEGYVIWLAESGEDADLRMLAPETKLEVPLVDDVTLMAKLDVRVEDRKLGSRLSLEHKTVQSLKQPLPLLQLDTQLLTEHLVEFLYLKDHPDVGSRADGVLYNMLRKVKRTARAKPPFFGRETVMHNETELRNHWYHVVSQAREIQEVQRRLDAGENHHKVVPPSPERSCSWSCPMFMVCPMFDDGSDIDQALEDLYEVGDPLERYEGVQEYEEVIS